MKFSTPEPLVLAYYWLVWRDVDLGTSRNPALRQSNAVCSLNGRRIFVGIPGGLHVFIKRFAA